MNRSLVFVFSIVALSSIPASPSAPPVVRSAPVEFRLPGGELVRPSVTPFSVTVPRTRFVVGRRGAADVEFGFDASRIALYDGTLQGRPGSRVFLALGDGISTGHVETGDGRFYRVTGVGGDGGLTLVEAVGPAGPSPDVPLCGTATPHGTPPTSPWGQTSRAVAGPPGLKQIELAVETDYEYFQLFGDLNAAAAYLVALYGEVSAIYARDVGARIDLVYARLWDDPDDLFNDVDPSPLSDFRIHWNSYMGGVQRDVAQLFSGRRDYPFGGQAYLSALCGDFAYGVVGYAAGFHPDPSQPSGYNYNVAVTAHELGHNAGTGHTQNNGVDSCSNPATEPQRGTIMSYCGQTWSGGNSNRDNYFHAVIQQNIEAHVSASACVITDCNENGVPDAQDAGTSSLDANANDVPDECEDCNINGVLDDQDIVARTSSDVDGNGIPDECQPDCDGNGVPDAKQIDDGATDAFGDGVPDVCEADCNQNSISDYTEIQADMGLDVDRNAALDACQDCDSDFVPDHDELAGAHDLWVSSGNSGRPLQRFFGRSGVLVLETQGAGGTIDDAQDLIVAPGGRVLVSSATENRIAEFGVDGTPAGTLVPAAAGGLSYPTGLLWRPDGVLLVASRNTDSVLSYNGATGAFLGELVGPGLGGLQQPFGMTFGPSGDLFVTSANGQVLRFDAQSGVFLGVFVAAGAGAPSDPRGIVFKPDGNLLVASFGSDQVLEFDGSSGAPLGQWAKVGTASVLTQTSPWGIRVGPNGNVFVGRTGEQPGPGPIHQHPGTLAAYDDDHGDHGDHGDDDDHGKLHLTNAQMYEYDVRNGNFLRAHIAGNDQTLDFPTGFDFVPGWDVDCNANFLPDECDLAAADCAADCNANGVLDRLDLIPFGGAMDCNANLVPDGCDIASATSSDCDGNRVPDECDTDCDGDGAVDACAIASGSVADCNSNGVPDLCEATFDFESNQGWTSGAAGDTATDGAWIRTNPLGSAAQSEFDTTPGPGSDCWITGQGSLGGAADDDDVDGGVTTLVSPPLALSSSPQAEIGYWLWYSNDSGPNPAQDALDVEITSNGSTWVTLETVGPTGPGTSGGWSYSRFRVADHVTPTDQVRLRVRAFDDAPDSTVEAAIDDVFVVEQCCQEAAACDDGLGCTVDSCNAGAGACLHEITAASCLIDGVCWAGGQFDPLDGCRACDPASPAGWTPAPPAEVGGVLVGSEASFAELTWADEGGAAAWDIVSGIVSSIVPDDGVGGASCLVEDLAGPGFTDMRPGPPPGDGFYYLVRTQKPCGSGGYGTSSDGTPRIPASDCN